MIRIMNINDKHLINDSRISFKAKGIMYYLSNHDNEEISTDHLVEVSTDGTTSIRNGINELENFGYLKRTRVRNNDGYYKNTMWDVYFTPFDI